MSETPTDTSPGWKPDPLGTRRLLRHWDGTRWTSRTITVEDLAAGLKPREEMFEDIPSLPSSPAAIASLVEMPVAPAGTALPEWNRVRHPALPLAHEHLDLAPETLQALAAASPVAPAAPVDAAAPAPVYAAPVYASPTGLPLTALQRLAAERAASQAPAPASAAPTLPASPAPPASWAAPASPAPPALRPAPPVATRTPAPSPSAVLPPGGPPKPLVLGGVPLHAVGPFRVYVCGITPYDVTHLGHAATYLWTDLACRVVRAQGTRVVLTRNVSDIDTPLLAEARRRGMQPDMLGTLQRASFDATMERLGVRTPDAQPTAATSVGQVQSLVAALLDRGAAYVHDGTVWARAAQAASALDPAEAVRLLAEFGQTGLAPGQEHQLDVPVWLPSAADEPAWPSPWGSGRPGWHAECAAMVLGAYGSGVDLHAGGADLVYPHHACESFLASAATGVTPFARGWLHAGTVRLNGQKMAKSTGNLVLVDELLERHAASAIRLTCLQRPYGEAWDYTPALVEAAEQTLAHLVEASAAPGPEDGAAEVDRALLTELDVPLAVEVALDGGGPAARRLLQVAALG